jgi:putative tryptophan/tyrosine transport system substrate-binding protein
MKTLRLPIHLHRSLCSTAGNVRNAAEIEYAITSFAQKENGGLVVLPHALSVFNASAIIALAQRYRMPNIHAVAEAVAAGGLVSYGINWDGQFHRPADLPVQAPTKYELVINLKTAKALGLEVPPTLLARADEVIE